MATQTSPVVQQPPGRSVLLSDIDWATYSQLLHVFAERRRVRLAYDRGELEIMSPRFEHDIDARFLCLLVFALTEELGLPVKPGGTVTMRRRSRRRGIEADETFWIAGAARMAGKRRLNLRTDPPPDLAIEVDISHSSLDRLGIYAVLRVPEVWRLNDDVLTFHVLRADLTYETAAVSRAFPILTPADALGFLQQGRQAGDMNPLLRQFREWVRRRIASSQPPTP